VSKKLNEAMDRDAAVRATRQLESKLAGLGAALDLERAKRQQAEQDLAETNARLDLFLSTSDQIEPRKIESLKKTKGGSATAVLCLSDWHAEEQIDSKVVNGLNEFNLEIATKRINRTWSKTIELVDFLRHLSNIKDIVVWLGGDLINGYIHEENLEGNFVGPTEAILYIQDAVAGGLQSLLPHFDSIRVVTSYGNHGRSTHKRRISTGYKSSWEWLAYNNLAGYFRHEKKISFLIERGYHSYVNIQDRVCRFHHGDAIKFGGGVGGVHIPLRKKVSQWNKSSHADYDFLGHFHQFIDDWNYIVNGCLCGYNAYAIEIGAEYQEPSQTLAVIDNQHGKVIACPIFCEEGKK
jgi:hypothetical protein